MSSYQNAVETLYRLQFIGQKLGLQTIGTVLDRLGRPETKFRSVHIAGTNGKGSTAAILARILQADGRRVGLYTSPHLSEFTERIRVNGVPIPKTDVARLTDRIAREAASLPEITFFEFTTAMAFAWFAEASAEIAVIETGLGGRLDATNVLVPEVSVLTNIGLDHREHLGDTLDAIAREKAGILKTGIPAVTGARQPEVLDVFSEVSREKRSPLFTIGEDFCVDGDSPESFQYKGIRNDWTGLSLVLSGRHQLDNAACALAAVELLGESGIRVSEAPVREGLRSVRWEGRLETLESPGEPRFLLDGAHNTAGAEALAAYLKEVPKGRLVLVVGILMDKDIRAMLEALAPLAETVIVAQPRYHRAAPAAELAEHVRALGIEPRVTGSVEEAVRLARTLSGPGDTVCIAGSLFTVGEARAVLTGQGEPSALKG